MYALCLRMVGNTAEAEDLAQDAFLQLFRKIATFRGESAFSTWLHRLAVNVVLMKLRKKTLSETPLEETNDPEDESSRPRRELGAFRIYCLPVRLIGFTWTEPSASCHPDISRFLCCTISMVLSTMRSRT